MNNSTTSLNTSPDPIPANAFLIRPNRGASKALKAVKNELKRLGCRWHSSANTWSCPAPAKEVVEAMLAGKQIGITSAPFHDDYFLKSQSGQEVERLWIQIDVLEKKHQAESMALLTDRAAIDREIKARGLALDSQELKDKLNQLDLREEAQRDLNDEILQLRNSIQLLEADEEAGAELPFYVLGYNSKKEILIWQNGHLISLPAGRLNKDELRLYIGGDSDWFQSEDKERRLKDLIIDTAHRKGFIDDEASLKAGVWRINGKWIVISGNRAILIDGAEVKELKEPIFEGKLIETNVPAWIDWTIFQNSIEKGEEGLKEGFSRIHEKVKLWNWVDSSMAAFATAYIMLSGVQQAMKWRPWLYLTGAKSTGKSTFFEAILQTIYGTLVERLDKSTAHATAQTIGNSGRIPVFDEFEKHKHIPDLLELAKLCNKGGQKSSGTGAEKAYRFHLHHMPWFGSIYLPKRVIQDAAQESRTVKLELKRLDKGAPLLQKFEADEGPRIASLVTASLISSWDAIETRAQEINESRNLLIQEMPGIEIRTVENFMYAAAILILAAPELSDPIIPPWAAMQMEDDGEKLLDVILGTLVKIDGEAFSIRELVQLSKSSERYAKELERYGLRLSNHKSRQYLALKVDSVNRYLLKDTDYASLDIKGPLARIEDAVASAQVKLAGSNQRCVLLPVERLGDFA